MDQGLVTMLRTVGGMNRQEATTALISALRSVGVGRHTVRAARDRFENILGQARNGTPQLIGASPKTITVVMSLTDLVDMLQAAAEKQSFGDALDEAGFQPVTNKKFVAREGFPPEPLLWTRSKKPDRE